jgi:hypothetical protein
VLCPSNVYGRGDALKSSRKTQLQVARGEMKFFTFGGINIVDVDDVVTAFIAAWRKGISIIFIFLGLVVVFACVLIGYVNTQVELVSVTLSAARTSQSNRFF